MNAYTRILLVVILAAMVLAGCAGAVSGPNDRSLSKDAQADQAWGTVSLWDKIVIFFTPVQTSDDAGFSVPTAAPSK